MLRSDLASRRVAHLPPRARRRYEERGLEILARVISSLKSPEAKRRLAPAVRYRLQAAAIDRKVILTRLAIELDCRFRHLEPVDLMYEDAEVLREALA